MDPVDRDDTLVLASLQPRGLHVHKWLVDVDVDLLAVNKAWFVSVRNAQSILIAYLPRGGNRISADFTDTITWLVLEDAF